MVYFSIGIEKKIVKSKTGKKSLWWTPAHTDRNVMVLFISMGIQLIMHMKRFHFFTEQN